MSNVTFFPLQARWQENLSPNGLVVSKAGHAVEGGLAQKGHTDCTMKCESPEGDVGLRQGAGVVENQRRGKTMQARTPVRGTCFLLAGCMTSALGSRCRSRVAWPQSDLRSLCVRA